ncbi:MAG TPA: STM4015 family protein [Chloroflexia bacterium]|nr:STM4015 family protein [Chloroflexia bacterium]
MDRTYEHITEFSGLPVVDWEPDMPLEEASRKAYRLSLSWEETEQKVRWTDKLAVFLSNPASREVIALLVGPWGEVATGEDDATRVVEALVSARDQLPALSALFLGEIIAEESEISWIQQSDVAPLLAAYPRLEEFWVRGGNNLSFGKLRHDRLKKLVVQSGGLPRGVVHQIVTAALPNVEHLEIWLGVEDYGGDAGVEDLAPLFSGQIFPRLEYLGLRDCAIVDDVARAIADAPVLDRVKVLDLSLGTLTDSGAEALLAGSRIRQLKKLDLHYHYCSQEIVEKLKQIPIEIDAGDPQNEDQYHGEVYRYVAVSE